MIQLKLQLLFKSKNNIDKKELEKIIKVFKSNTVTLNKSTIYEKGLFLEIYLVDKSTSLDSNLKTIKSCMSKYENYFQKDFIVANKLPKDEIREFLMKK